MSDKKYTYSILNDFPDGKVNQSRLIDEILASDITIAFKHIVGAGDTINLWFKNTLPSGDKTILDGDTLGPASGLIAIHDNSDSISEIQQVAISGSQDVTILNIPQVVSTKYSQSTHNRIYSFSVDMCKRETWYVDSQYVADCLVSSGVTNTSFTLPYGSESGAAILDLSHGKITEENLLVAPTGSYLPQVYIDDVLQVERECYEESGGDYQIDYATGELEFFITQSGVITADYYYVPTWAGPRFIAKPPAGKKWVIDYAELQASVDMIMTDTISYNVFLTHPQYGYIPSGPALEYKNFGNFLDFTFGSYPLVPAMGGPSRGTTKETAIFRWNYLAPIELTSSLQMELISWTNHKRGYDGARCVLAIHGLETDE
jgi:hypothetical protein